MVNKNLKKIITIDSGKPGPVVSIMGGTHGNEPCGINTLNYLKNNLKLISGKVYLILGNPSALEKNIRFIDTNLNRIFQDDVKLSEEEKASYEYVRSKEIIPFLDKSEILIDIHSVAKKNTEPFVICESKSLELAKFLPITNYCHGFCDIEPGATECYMEKKGKLGICIECGSNESNKASQIAKKSVEIILTKLGMIDNNIICNINDNRCLFAVNSLYKTQTNKFRLTKNFENFEYISAGIHIATDGDEKVFSDSDSYILFAHNRDKPNEEGFVLLKKL